MDNIAKQYDEVEVLSSIYGEDWYIDNEEHGLYHITLNSDPVQLTLCLEMPEAYPSESPPLFQIVSSSLQKADIDEITNILQELYLESVGETVIYQWIERTRDWLREKAATSTVESQEINYESFPSEENEPEDMELLNAQIEENFHVSETSCTSDSTDWKSSSSSSSSITIIHGDPITYKKSTFQGHAAIISHPEEMQSVLRELMENKKIAHATHNIQAYRIFKEASNTYEEHFEDDGEKQAGHRLLHLLQVMNIQNVMVVVSRWYGGVHLGPDRFRLINNAAKEVLGKGNLIPPPEARKKK